MRSGGSQWLAIDKSAPKVPIHDKEPPPPRPIDCLPLILFCHWQEFSEGFVVIGGLFKNRPMLDCFPALFTKAQKTLSSSPCNPQLFFQKDVNTNTLKVALVTVLHFLCFVISFLVILDWPLKLGFIRRGWFF